MRHQKSALIYGVLPLVLGATAAAQTTATILGTVTDASGAVVSGARLTITQVDTGLVRTILSLRRNA